MPKLFVALLIAFGLSLASLLPGSARAQSNLGTSFALAFPMDEDEYLVSTIEDSLLVFLFSPTTTYATVRLGFANYVRILVPADSIVSYALPPTFVLYDKSTLIRKDKVIFITSDDPIAVVGMEDPADEIEVFGVPPIASWGRDYIVPSTRKFCRAAIVAAYDSTVINFRTPWANIRTATLMSGQVLEIVDTNYAVENRFTSSKPVALIGCGIGEATIEAAPAEFIPPASNLGKLFFYAPSAIANEVTHAHASRDSLFFSAVEDSTFVFFNGSAAFRLDAGHDTATQITTPSEIAATRPVLIQDLFFDTDSNIGHDDRWIFALSDMATLPSTQQFENDVYFCSPRDSCWATIVHPAEETDSLTIDGVRTPARMWRAVGSQMACADIPLKHGMHHAKSTIPFGIVVHWMAAPIPWNWKGPPPHWPAAYNPSLGTPVLNPLFGNVDLNYGRLLCASSMDTLVVLQNLYIDTLRIDSLVISGPDRNAFSLASRSFPIYLINAHPATDSVARTLRIPIHFAPSRVGSSNATINVYCSEAFEPISHVVLSGYKDSVGIQINVNVLDFGTRISCEGDTSLTFTLQNTGTVSAQVSPGPLPANAMAFVPPLLPFTLPAGATSTISVQFGPQFDSLWNDTLVIHTQCDSIAVVLRGEHTTPIVAARDQDFGFLCAGDSVVKYVYIRNPSAVALSLDNATVNSPFKILPNQLPINLPPHDSVPIKILCLPTMDGNFSSTFIFGGQPCDVGAYSQLRGARGTAVLSASGADFGTVCVGGSVAKSIVIHNTGTVAASVDSIVIANGFKILTPLPLSVNAGDSQSVMIMFTPTSSVPYSSSVNIFGGPCGITTQTVVSGAGTDVSVAMAGLDFGLVNSAHDSIIVFHNTGTDTITASSATLQSCNACGFTLASNVPATIAPGDSLIMRIHFAPSITGVDSAIVCVAISSPCVEMVCAPVMGSAQIFIGQTVSLCPDSVAIQQWGSIFDVKIDLSDPVANNGGLAFTVVCDPKLLLYQGIISSALPATANAVAAGMERIAFVNNGVLANGQLCDLRFMALASSNDTIITTIAIDSAVFTPPNATAARCTVPVTIAPPCGLKGVAYVAASSITAVSPNPITDDGNIAIHLNASERASATLRVYDLLGSLVKDGTGLIRSMTSDDATLMLHARELSASLYTIVLQTPASRAVRQVAVIH